MEGTPNFEKKLVVIGGGAAGFFCAVNAARMHPFLQVCIVERSGKLLSKVSISGGGRCNVTHACSSAEEMAHNYPRGEKFMRKTLHAFGPLDTVQWFQERGVPLKTEKDGRMFPVSDSSQSVIDCLMREAERYHVEVKLHFPVRSLKEVSGRWILESADGKQLSADYVCIACGGFPSMEQFNWILALGHSIEIPVPSLFTFNMPGNPITALSGVAVPDAIARIPVTSDEARGPLLITHWGMSGPAILRLSAWAARTLAQRQWDFEFQVNWVPAFHEQSFLSALKAFRVTSSRQLIGQRNPFGLPSRLWIFLLSLAGLKEEQDWGNCSDKQLHALMNACCRCTFHVRGKTTFKEEFVTAGGVVTHEIDTRTMQSKLCPGLFFAGEIINVDGITGGFNFQHAWTSGWMAARHIAALAQRETSG